MLYGVSEGSISRTTSAHSGRSERLQRRLQTLARHWFGCELLLVDGSTGEPLVPPEPIQAAVADWEGRSALCQEAARRGTPQFIADETPLAVLAIPFPCEPDGPIVALGTFAIGSIDGPLPAEAARLVQASDESPDAWFARQTVWTAESLTRLAQGAVERWTGDARIRQLEHEVQNLSLHLSTTYEEISLLHRLAQNLRLSKSDDELCQTALEWLADVVPAESFAVQLIPVDDEDPTDFAARTEPMLLMHGPCPLDYDEFSSLLRDLGIDQHKRPTVVNGSICTADGWRLPAVRQAVVVPLAEGSNLFGWLAAFNHNEDGEFGSVEASLLSSVGALLGIHCGNTELYRQQRELLAGVVRALTSAIDAKDPYTCGHSDRVARIAARLAEELGCNDEELNTVYLCGLLHDVGKIGIDDNVLRKPGKLTTPEYEHIKLHAEIGYRILQDIRQFDDILPAVLHHHEQWDGRGYPHCLTGERIPLFGRIVAVADAYDAMSSDRPYRQGMSPEKLDAILREGAGTQWDPQVIAAYFRAHDDIRQIGDRQRTGHEGEVRQWV